MSEEPTRNLLQDGFDRILAGLDRIDTRLDTLDARLTALEDKVERRLQDTRPMWEQVLIKLDGVESRQAGFEDELRSSLRRFERQVGLLAEDVMKVRADQSDLDRRVDRIESKMTP